MDLDIDPAYDEEEGFNSSQLMNDDKKDEAWTDTEPRAGSQQSGAPAVDGKVTCKLSF